MQFVVGLSGTHGTGKSTILHGVESLGFPIVDSQLARTAQKALGWDHLSKAQESVENMWSLQDAVLDAMNNRDEEITKSQAFTLTERSPADIWAYTTMWCERLGINTNTDQRARDYYQRCVELAKRYAGFLIVPMTDAIPFVVEPNRADLESRIPVAETINEFVMTHSRNHLVPVHFVSTVRPDERIEEAREFLSLIENNNGLHS